MPLIGAFSEQELAHGRKTLDLMIAEYNAFQQTKGHPERVVSLDGLSDAQVRFFVENMIAALDMIRLLRTAGGPPELLVVVVPPGQASTPPTTPPPHAAPN